MDVGGLLLCFAGTLDQNSQTRSNAELQLKQVSSTPGFLGACLDIIAAEPTPENIRLSASLYFKNKCVNGWNGKYTGKNDLLNYVVDQDEKPVIKDMLIHTLVACVKASPRCARVLKSALGVIVYTEFSEGHWDDLLTRSFKSLAGHDLDEAYVGLLCLSEIFRTYRWKENDSRQGLEVLILQYFPDLLRYGTEQLLKGGAKVSDVKRGEMLLLLIKIYKFVTYLDLPFTLQRSEAFIPWANFFVAIIQMPLTADFVTGNDHDSRSKNPWVKCKKWSYAILYRLYQRFASESLTRKFEYEEFRNLYRNEFLPQLLQLLFQQLEQWSSGALWLSDECLYYILSFIEQTIVQKPTWKLVKPHYATILEHVIFPMLCPNDEKLEIFENDPQEYIHRNLELWDENYSPDLAAVSVLTTSVTKHGKYTLQPTVEFVIATLQANVGSSASLPIAVKVESAFRIFSSIVDRLTTEDSPYLSELETFLNTFVFPFFSSPFGFLRTRVCEICSKLGAISFQKSTLVDTIYGGIMVCLNDSNGCLPAQLLAALALQAFIHVPEFQTALSPVVLPIMQKLLDISNEFESDTISGVMQDFVEQFADQLQPFGVDLMNTLVQQFLKLAIELHEASNVDPNSLLDDNDIPDESDKQMAALGILSTTISILLSFENSPEMLKNLEQSFYPAAEFILKYEIEDFYRECCEFVENSTFLLRNITPISWKILELIGESNRKQDSMVSFYLEDCIYALNNYLLYGSDELRKNEFYSRILFEIYDKAVNDADKTLSELATVLDLSQKMILSLNHSLTDAQKRRLINDATHAIVVKQEELRENIVFGVTSFNVIASGLAYFPTLTLEILKTYDCIELFFKTWLTFYVPNVKRVYDIKLSILALLNIITEVPDKALATVLGGDIIPRLGKTTVDLISRFPSAQRLLQEKRMGFSTGAFSLDEPNDWKNDSGTLKFVNGETFDAAEDFEDLEEDSLSGSLLDPIDVYASVKIFAINLQTTNPEKYTRVGSEMSPDDQVLFNRIIS
ncbi:probable NMD5-Nam7p interacting protein [Zygosaccharomyces bailii ISA1307]|uniref:ZYBA0S10-04368g1_1 n=1 Tax=Zygosaccharomyces bailii (strain CLIB 213 / ATCC 58445 / CBS 680 / BCRC 21525 / NBRC 1098 / NCYC 1416 / NRRL Y-2227) TaxID=1333698 RepID=A0A8J2T9H6_ZYGB2|nr:ZYBA0S10-04368g1_1 [Zygosaccharomyces bailii CLIB 213]CDH17076.1 probable NMD5-Nam7p interacting protein [Zygosaccharomyces bailii ISA1307]